MDELLGGLANLRFRREHDLMRIENGRLLEDGLLCLIVAKWFLSEQKFVEYDSDRPNVNFVGYLRFILLEALWRLVPVGANALRSQLYLLVALLDDLAEAEIRNLHFSVVEDDVLWF